MVERRKAALFRASVIIAERMRRVNDFREQFLFILVLLSNSLVFSCFLSFSDFLFSLSKRNPAHRADNAARRAGRGLLGFRVTV